MQKHVGTRLSLHGYLQEIVSVSTPPATPVGRSKGCCYAGAIEIVGRQIPILDRCLTLRRNACG